MRLALWFLALFGVAVALAVFAGNNDATVTLYWVPYRIDLSLNFFIVGLISSFALIYAAIRTATLLFALPEQARRWRSLQKERGINLELLNAQSHFLAGRYIRAQKSALTALSLDKSREHSLANELVGNESQVRALAHIMVAQSAHALQDRAVRDEHLQKALEQHMQKTQRRAAQDTREGAQLLAANWALEDRDVSSAQSWLKQLATGAARRTFALRLKLKAAQLGNASEEALETTRLLAKHHGFSKDVAPSLIKSLVLKRLDDSHDVAQLQNTWNALEQSEKLQADIAIHAAYKMSLLSDSQHAQQITQWLLPAWSGLVGAEHGLNGLDEARLLEIIFTLEKFFEAQDLPWLARVEQAQLANPRDVRLLYLAGSACMSHHLWGKAQQLLTQASQLLNDNVLKRKTSRALALLAEQRGDMVAAADAWKRAALVE